MMPLRLRRVAGYEGRLNDALFLPAARPPSAPHLPRTLVFFPGDVQDYGEVMATHRDNKHYQRWNLECTARLLGIGFPNHHILVVRPSRIELKSFSCYDNFVPSNNAGVPDHTPTHHALRHLERLLQSVSARLKQMPASELLEAMSSTRAEDTVVEDDHSSSTRQQESPGSTNGARCSAAGPVLEPVDPLWWVERGLEQSRLTLVGFSKGCVVLNQFIYEFHYTGTLTPGDRHATRFIERICSMYWLDGGHAGGRNTWLTARSLLQTLASLGVRVFVHVSPYQVRDEARPWIGREERAFTNTLHKLNAKVNRYFHEGAAPYSLLTHFSVLSNFKRVQETAPPADTAGSDDDTST